MKQLYAVSHRRPSEYVQRILFDKDYPEDSIFNKVKNLPLMSSKEQAGFIIENKIPFIIVLGVLKVNKEDVDPDLVLALMERMTGQQLISNAKFIHSLGVKNNNILKIAYDEAFKRALKDQRVTVGKVSKAIDSFKLDEDSNKDTINSLVNVQEKKLDNSKIEGDWVILGDCSGSMDKSIEFSKSIASYVARSVEGKVYLIFFHSLPLALDVTGKTLKEIKDMTYHIKAAGGTFCGCGLELLREKKIEVNGIAIVTDGGDHGSKEFYQSYKDYCNELSIQPSIYMYKVSGEYDTMSKLCITNGIDININDLRRGKITEDSLQYMVSTMRANKYSLIDDINNISLLTIQEAFKTTSDKYGKH